LKIAIQFDKLLKSINEYFRRNSI